MNKLLYIAPVIIDLDKQNGVTKKVLNHYKTFGINYDVEMISYGPDCLYHFYNDTINTIDTNGQNRRIQLYKYINISLTRNKKIDFVYIRYHLCDYLFLFVLKNLYKVTSKIVIEIPTYPYKKELLKTSGGLLKWYVDVTSRLFLRFFVGRIVTYSKDDNIFGIQTIKTCNGIVYDDVKIAKKINYNEAEINLISASITMSCHGYDRIIKGLSSYYSSGGNVNIIYHLVGDGAEIENYINLVKELNLEKNVIIYGFKGGQELEEIYDKADVAIDSLGIHRVGLKTESTLKTREYAAKGLPIISSNLVDVFSDEDNFKYVYRVSADDSDVDMHKLIGFYKSLHIGTDRSDISETIRSKSQKRCDMKVTLEKVNRYYNSNI